jgi:hypothetical protein
LHRDNNILQLSLMKNARELVVLFETES